MCKKDLREEPKLVDAAATVDDAAKWADGLVAKLFRGPGDTIQAARHRAEQRYGVPAALLWALRYRRPKAIFADIYLKLKEAYEAEVMRQEARLAHELEITRLLPRTPDRDRLIAETEAFLGLAPSAQGTAEAAPSKDEGR